MKRPPGGWVGGTRRFVLLDFRLVLRFHPISLVLPKETGWSPKEKRLGWWRPREVSGPARLSHSRGSCHSAAEVSAPRTIAIWALRAAGMVKTPRRGVFYFNMGCVVNRRPGGDGTPPLCDAVNKYRARHTRQRKDPRQPRRGRRPRRPAATVTAGPTAFRRPPPGRGITAGVMASQQPCRGRRPRRPAASVSADLATFRLPPPGVGRSRSISRGTRAVSHPP